VLCYPLPDTLSQRALSQHQSSQQQFSQVYFDTTTTTSTSAGHSSHPLASSVEKKTLPSEVNVLSSAPTSKIPATIIENEKENDQSGDAVEKRPGGLSGDGGVGGLARATTLIPTQDTERPATTLGNIREPSPKKSARTSAASSKRRKHSPTPTAVKVEKVVEEKEQKEQKEVIKDFSEQEGSPMQMCDINIEVDLSEEETKVAAKLPSEEADGSAALGTGKRSKKDITPVKKTIEIQLPSPSELPKEPPSNLGLKLKSPSAPSKEEEIPNNQKKTRTSKKRKAADPEQEREEEVGDEDFSAPPPRSRRKKQQQQQHLSVVEREAEVDVDMSGGGVMMSGFDIDNDGDGGNQYDDDDDNEEEGDEGGWCVSSRRTKKKKKRQSPQKQGEQMALERRKQLEESLVDVKDEEDVTYPQAVSIEVQFALREKATTSTAAAAAGCTGASSAASGRGDKRRFVKNYVRGHFQNSAVEGRNNTRFDGSRPQVIISLCQLEKLLPKESEREVQVMK
jgi:hypothetical protein